MSPSLSVWECRGRVSGYGTVIGGDSARRSRSMGGGGGGERQKGAREGGAVAR